MKKLIDPGPFSLAPFRWPPNDAVGNKRDLTASHDKDYFKQLQSDGNLDTKDDYATYLHGMDEVIDSTEQQKGADEAALKRCLTQ